jgi:deoxyribodipyrimidine photo-lyase
MRTLVWLRSDLRTRDNTALHRAAKDSDQGIVCVYVISPEAWRAHDVAPVRADYVLRTLAKLSSGLEALQIPLLIESAPREADVPSIILSLAKKHGCDAVACNIEYEVNESRRDERVRAILAQSGIAFRAHHDQTVIPPAEIRTGEGRFYTVFTPFKKAWMR